MTSNAVVSADSSGTHTTIQAAIAAAPDDGTNAFTILIKPGIYEGPFLVTKSKRQVRLVGERAVVDRQRDEHRDHAERDRVELRRPQMRGGPRGIGRRAVDHHDADAAQREHGGDEGPVDVIVEATLEHLAIGVLEDPLHVGLRRRRRQRAMVFFGEKCVEDVVRHARGVVAPGVGKLWTTPQP